jgi:hypothetical protein
MSEAPSRSSLLLALSRKPRVIVIMLIACSLGLSLLDAGEHWLKAKSASLLISILKPSDPEIERIEEMRKDHYESVVTSGVTVLALGTAICLVVGSKPGADVT